MNKPLGSNELRASSVMLDRFLGSMDRTTKLRRWASLCRGYKASAGYLVLYHGLEHWKGEYLQTPLREFSACGVSAMTLAMNDPKFQQAGLPADGNIKDIMKFFEISQHELHAFSCDCGGHVDNYEQARRIEGLIR
jgi:hypothetical protein